MIAAFQVTFALRGHADTEVPLALHGGQSHHFYIKGRLCMFCKNQKLASFYVLRTVNTSATLRRGKPNISIFRQKQGFATSAMTNRLQMLTTGNLSSFYNEQLL